MYRISSVLTALVLFASLSLVGVFRTFIGTALPQMTIYSDSNTLKSGMMGSISWVGFMMAVLLCGFLSAYFGSNLVLVVSSGLAGIASLVLGITSHVLLNPNRRGPFLNSFHFFYIRGAKMEQL